MLGYYEWITTPQKDIWSALESPERLADIARRRNQVERDLMTDRRGLAPQTDRSAPAVFKTVPTT
jgi:hypothetical protein